jgi:hypothetical protein
MQTLTIVSEFFLEWEMFQIKCVEKSKTNVLCSVYIFSENGTFYEIMWKIRKGQTGYRRQHNTAHAIVMLGNWDKNTDT